MKRTIFSIIACVVLANGADNNYEQNRAGVDGGTFETNEVINTRKEMKNDDLQDNTYAVIYNHLQRYEIMKDKESVVKQGTDFTGQAPMSAFHDFHADRVALEEKALQEQQKIEEEATKPLYAFLDGYCVLQNEVKIGRIAGYADLSCDLSVNEHATLKVALTPDFYSKALIATPLYVNLSGKRYTIVAGAVQNGIRTSINVATEVDDYLISRIAADTAVGTASIATQYAQDYLDEKRAYRESKNNKKKTNQTVTTGGTVIITEEDASEDMPPKISDYWGGALVEIGGKLIESIGNAYLQTREYSFKIDAKTVMFADLQINLNEQGIKGVGFEPQNLIVQQPSTNFTDSDPTQGIDYPNANIGALPQTGTNINTNSATRQQEQSAARSRNVNSRNTRERRDNRYNRNQGYGYGAPYNGGIIDTRGNY